MTTEFNIGLSNNPYDVVDIISILNALFDDTPITFSIDDGLYNGAIEPTLAVVYDDTLDTCTIEALCVEFEQTCIAVKFNGVGELIYTPDYTGERQQFNADIFITPRFVNTKTKVFSIVPDNMTLAELINVISELRQAQLAGDDHILVDTKTGVDLEGNPTYTECMLMVDNLISYQRRQESKIEQAV